MATPKLIVGNWKMNLDAAAARDLAATLSDTFHAPNPNDARVVVCPNFVHLALVSQVLATSAVALGAQNCADRDMGALTGEVAAAQILDYGCQYVILGHSERRSIMQESSEHVSRKVQYVQDHGALIPIVCVGEPLEVREAGQAQAYVKEQLLASLPLSVDKVRLVVAYEPVWAIGTGKTASPEDIADMHVFLAGLLPDVPLLYGGSVKPDNARGILTTAHVDGVLVGGASLNADHFIQIATAV